MNRTTLILKMARELGKDNEEGEILTDEPRTPEITKDDNVIITENNISFHSMQHMIENAEVIMDFPQASVIVSNLPEQCSKPNLGDLTQGIDLETNLVQLDEADIQEYTLLESGEIVPSSELPDHLEKVAQEINEVQPNQLEIQNSVQNETIENVMEVLRPEGEEEREINTNNNLVPTQLSKERKEKKILVRKKVCKPEAWKSNIRKQLCQTGKEYISTRGKQVNAKTILNKKDCLNKCKFHCGKKIGEDARKRLFHYYYELNQNEKYLFLRQVTERYVKGRKTTEGASRRAYSFKYFFKVQEEQIQVCKQFFLGTLNISQKPVYTVHSVDARKRLFHYYYELNQNEKYLFLRQVTERYVKGRKTTEGASRRAYSFKYFFKVQEEQIQVCKQFFLGTLNISQKPVYTVHSVDRDVPKKDMRGKTGTRKLSSEKKQVVTDHIKKFNVVESHYCRHNSQRKYLEATLTIPKMYNLYLTYCAENNIQSPVKLSMYRHIFCTNFNYSFHKPKKDVCETCATYYLKKKENRLSDIEEEAMKKHIAEKAAMRKEKENDKKSGIPVLCFDLENVITCPKSFIGNYFYLQKLTMYNLTGHLSTTNKAYCALWIETLQGRSGNCLASAFRKIIEKMLEDNHFNELITWSDSCVPQNRNSHISFCVLDLLKNHPDLNRLTMKYSIPGHGAVQEVDNIHSQIERHMSQREFYSPLGFIKELKQVNKKNPFAIIQMRESDFMNYEECSKQLQYDKVPFTKVSVITFSRSDLSEVCFKKSYRDNEFINVSISPAVPALPRRRSKKTTEVKAPAEIANLTPKVDLCKKDISKEKINALKKMMPSMPKVDQDFYKALLDL